MKIVLGVTGGIAAYKAVQLLRIFTEASHEVHVVPTAAALRFVGEPTWAALSGQPVATEVWPDVHEIPHVRIGQEADLVVVAPATADILARCAHGLADDLLTNVLLTARCPIVFAPAMHSEMWENVATQSNVEILRARGIQVLEPATGRLAGADSGVGRLPEPEEIAWVALRVANRAVAGSFGADLDGKHVVVTAGGTREALDPVRFLSNRSSGRQGYALARTAVARGALVTLIAANSALPDPAGVTVVRVTSALELHQATYLAAATADAVVMAAAPADFRPAKYSASKIKKSLDGNAPMIELIQNPDILLDLVASRQSGDINRNVVLVGFAAETGDDAGSVLEYGQAKLRRKGCDLLVINEVGADRGFESPNNAAVIINASGKLADVPYGLKEDLADAVWDAVLYTSSQLGHQ